MTSKGQPSGGRRRARLNWRGRAAGALVGLAVAMTGNLISEDFGYPAVAAALVGAAVLAASTWVRQLPTQAPLVRYVIRLLLLAAAVAAVTAALGPQAWAPWATIIAALLTIAVVLIPVDALTALAFLFGTAFIGTGVAYIGAVAVPFLLTEGRPLDGVVGIGVSIVAIGVGCVFLIGGDTPGGAMAIRAQVANKDGTFLAGGNRYVAIAVGLAGIAMGIPLLTVGDSLGGTAALVGGVAFIGYGIFRRLAGAAAIVVGVACILLGCAWLADTGILLGGAAIGMGVAQIGFGVSHLIYHGPPPQWRDWWTRMTTASQHPAGAEPDGPGQNDPAQRTAPTSGTSTATVSSPRSSRSGSGVTGNPRTSGRQGSPGSPRTGQRPRRRRR
ncbi:hypothetical protein [Micromonospora sp. NPDC093244]|uniref:hypothetical protein n=1 Tax=Micromonospora sp. NPDC093244 TaxID=3155071 RepID=UPI00343336C2